MITVVDTNCAAYTNHMRGISKSREEYHKELALDLWSAGKADLMEMIATTHKMLLRCDSVTHIGCTHILGADDATIYFTTQEVNITGIVRIMHDLDAELKSPSRGISIRSKDAPMLI